jgi:hypothetical protein
MVNSHVKQNGKAAVAERLGHLRRSHIHSECNILILKLSLLNFLLA